MDGTKRTVTDSVTSDEDDTYINFCYPMGSRIVHDPKIGVARTNPIEPTTD